MEMLNEHLRDTPNFKDQRRERIIQVARSVFFEVGYAGASMSLISQRLGGSKATLYAYFSSKEELFAAIIREGCQDMAAIFQAHIGTNDLRSSLTQVAREMMSLILSDWGNRTLQLIIEESPRNPELPKLFHNAIESSGKQTMKQLLLTAHDKGQVKIDDVEVAAGILKSLLFGEIHFKRLLNLCPPPSPERLHAHIDRAIDVFLTYYGTEGRAG